MILKTVYASLKWSHAYEVEVDANGDTIKVFARNRAQAAKYLTDRGYTVRAVNMVG